MINTLGQILAYKFNGDSYFYSLQGLFGLFDPRSADYVSKGFVSPFVTSEDFQQDGEMEVVASYTAPRPFGGVGLFDGRTGLPYLDETDPVVIREGSVFGTALADLDNDGKMEIITLGKDTTGVPTLFATTNLNENVSGFPVSFPDISDWFISPLTLADLDLDGVPEFMFTAYWYDISHLFIIKSDGTPYKQLENEMNGVAFTDYVTMGTPVAADLVGDAYPEIVFRSGYLLPGTGPEKLYILDHTVTPVPGWPVTTPARPNRVFSTQYVPVVDDLDSDGKVELILLSDNSDVLVWDFEASYNNGKNKTRFLIDNLNSNKFYPPGTSTDINDNIDLLPASIVLRQNYPNPFNPTTNISFDLPRKSDVSLDVYNILGQKVTTLAEGEMTAGNHVIAFDGSTYASGIYFYRLKADETSITRKMVLVK